MRYWLLPSRLVAIIAALTIAMVTLSSCGVPAHGFTGVMIDSSGKLTAVFGWCPGHAPDGATLYTENERQSEVGVGHWEADHRLVGTYAELPLARPTQGWRATRPLPAALDPRREYVLFGGTSDNSSSTHPVEFTVAALQSNPRGTILVWAANRDENDGDEFINVDSAGFQRHVSDHFDC
jgi:hypothetical protein